jgi:hypothetical protein
MFSILWRLVKQLAARVDEGQVVGPDAVERGGVLVEQGLPVLIEQRLIVLLHVAGHVLARVGRVALVCQWHDTRRPRRNIATAATSAESRAER